MPWTHLGSTHYDQWRAIVVRLFGFSGTYVPRWLSPRLRQREPAQQWQDPFVIAFTGIRGVVSLAAALSIPFMISQDQLFPDRHLILFLTFSVIVVTLVLQGPTLPWLVKQLGLVDSGSKETQERAQFEAHARVEAARAALDRLEQVAGSERPPTGADSTHARTAARSD